MTTDSELARGFLLICDKELESEGQKLATKIRTTSGKVVLKTMEDVEDAKGATLDKKLDNILTSYSHGVVIVTSQNLTTFIDKKEKSCCPELLKPKYKDCISVIKKFFEKERKKATNKLILVSLNGDTSTPKALRGMSVLVNDGDMTEFTKKIVAQLTAKLSSSIM